MLDVNNYLAGELRHLAFRKSDGQESWQETARQTRRIDIENRLRSLAKDNILTDAADTLSSHLRQWRQNHRRTAPQVTGLPSHHGSN